MPNYLILINHYYLKKSHFSLTHFYGFKYIYNTYLIYSGKQYWFTILNSFLSSYIIYDHDIYG